MLNVFKSWMDRYFMNEETVLLFVLLVAAFAVIITIGDILTPAIAAVILAFLLQGLVNLLKKKGLSHLKAVWLTFCLFIGVFSSLLLIILPQVSNQLTSLIVELPNMIVEVQSLLMTLVNAFPGFLTQEDIGKVFDINSGQMATIGKQILSLSFANLANIFVMLIYLVLVPILVFFFLKDNQLLFSWAASFLPGERPLLNAIWAEMNVQIANYVRGKFIEIFIVGAVSYVTFVVLGLNYSALLGLLVGLSVVIPYIGAALVTFPVAAIAYLQWGWTTEFFYLFAAYSIIQALDGNVLVPLLFSEAVNLHPVAIILAVLIFGGFWGLWGVFFAIPLATLIKAILNAWPSEAEPSAQTSAV